MEAKKLVPILLGVAAAALLALSFSACGGGDDGDDTETVTTEATNESGENPESSKAFEAGGNAAAPSGDAVRAQKVEIVDFAYDPDPVTIEAGGKVIWQNEDSAPHTATAEDGSFDTGTLEEGKLKSETFKQPGTYEYVCSIHPDMHGTVEVVEAG